jgi:hypothetical protein
MEHYLLIFLTTYRYLVVEALQEPSLKMNHVACGYAHNRRETVDYSFQGLVVVDLGRHDVGNAQHPACVLIG